MLEFSYIERWLLAPIPYITNQQRILFLVFVNQYKRETFMDLKVTRQPSLFYAVKFPKIASDLILVRFPRIFFMPQR